MGPRITSTRRRKRWQVVASVFVYLLLGLWAWVESDDGSLLDAYAAANAWAVGFGFLDAAPPTTSTVGWLSNDEAVDWGDLQANASRLISVSSSAELSAALATAAPGDYIRVVDAVGAVTWSGLRTSVAGTATEPIVIGPQGVTGSGRSSRVVVFSGSGTWLDIKHSHYIVGGFGFSNHLGSAFQTLNAANVRITDCTFNNVGNAASGDGWLYQIDYNCPSWRIDHCRFQALANSARIDIYDPASTSNSINGRFDHNTIDGNVGEYTACQIGQGSAKYNNTADCEDNGGKWSAYCTFEYNHIANTGNYPEQPSVKSSNNIIRYNWYDGCKAQILVRQANDCQVYGNYVNSRQGAGAAAIEVYGARHVIHNNIVHVKATLDSAAAEMQGGFRTNTPVPPCRNTKWVNNTFYDPLGLCDRSVIRLNADPGGLTRGYVATSANQWINNIVLKNTGTFAAATKTARQTAPADGSPALTRNLFYGSAADGAGVGLDTSPIVGDPKLSATYELQLGSAAIAAGTYDSLAALDFFGRNRSITGIDVGAVQTSASPPAQRGSGLNRGMCRGGYMGGSV